MSGTRSHPLCQIVSPEDILCTIFYTLDTILVELDCWRDCVTLLVHCATFASSPARVQPSNIISSSNLDEITLQ
jgi:hypothetical protein